MKEPFNQPQGGINRREGQRLARLGVLLLGQIPLEVRGLLAMKFLERLCFGTVLELAERRHHLVDRLLILPFGMAEILPEPEQPYHAPA